MWLGGGWGGSLTREAGEVHGFEVGGFDDGGSEPAGSRQVAQ